nr:MAG TPA: hypothetical protein [Inoviridae sp.]
MRKILRKNEFRMDNNPKHFGVKKQPHPAYITARYGHMYKANSITHSRKTSDGKLTYDVFENPDKLSKDKNRKTRISPPYWQKDNLFDKDVLPNFRFSYKTRKQIKRYNKKFKQ